MVDVTGLAAGGRDYKTPIYVSYATFSTLIEWLAQMHTIPSRFDRSLWQGKFSGSNGAQLMVGLRFLGLLDGDKPTARLQPLVGEKPQERKQVLKGILRDAYGSDLVDNLSRMTPKMVDDAIAALGATEATRRKAFSFFVNAAKAAEISMPSTIAKKARLRGASRRAKTPGRSRKDTPATSAPVGHPTVKPQEPGGGGLEFHLHPVLLAMVRDLEKLAPSWSPAQRDAWLRTFEANLNYAYPAKDTVD
ncbi:MAG: hypothetical protein Q8O76_09045 [Chloroflexota bacterium]|nr:hypothetical protein [Chloroflexota bacterium]